MPHARFLPAFLLVALTTTAAHADWPSARHDPQRTGASQSVSDITKPAAYWKARVGGAIGSASLLTADVDMSGSLDLVYVTGGSVIAQRGNGQVLWQTPPLSFQSLSAIDDFDGDGKPEVLVAGSSQAFLLRGADGTIAWSEPPTDLGTLGGLRVGDLNGDGHPDIIAEECHCCQVTNGASGYAYAFSSSGGNVVGTQLWAYPPLGGDFYSCEVPTVLFDALGNGGVEIAHLGGSYMWIFASDGATLVDDTSGPKINTEYAYRGDCIPANVDGNPGDELVCFQRSVYGSALREAYVLHYNATTPPSLNLLWLNSTFADSSATGDLDFEPLAVVDLDGNGTMEVVVSGLASNVWTTYVFDGATGATLATMPNARAAGTAPLRADGKVNIMTTTGTGSSEVLTASVFNATQTPAVQSTWTLPAQEMLTQVDPALLRTLRADVSLATPDLNGDGIPDALTALDPSESVIYDHPAPHGTANQLAAFPFPANASLVGTWIEPGITETYRQVVTVGSDGAMRLFNNALGVDSSILVGGFCSGGMHNSPLVTPMVASGGPQSLLVSGSAGALLRFDAQNASLAGPPTPTWTAPNCVEPSVIPSLDGANPGIVCRSQLMPPTLSAINGAGSPIWNVPMPGDGVAGDALAGSPVSGSPTIFVQTVDSLSNALTLSLSATNGQELWASAPISLTDGIVPFSVSDWNGDGVLDVVSVLNTMTAISGLGGQYLITGTTHLAYAVPILADVNNDGTLEATLQAGYPPMQTLQHDLVTNIWLGPATLPYPAGGLAGCPSAPQLVDGSSRYPSRLYFAPAGGALAGTSTYVVLAGGKLYASEAAATGAGAFLGQLSDLSIGTNLTGSGHPTVVVGSTDGWVYALDACAGTLQWSMPFGESVCGAILGDTDGNGKDEILVGTSGGYVYDVQNLELPSPAPVIDTDPPAGIPNTEVSTIVTTDTLYGAWQAVPGATSYEIAIAQQPGGIISSPAWQDAGAGTSGAVSGLSLMQGQKYYFAARAVGPNGKSPDAISPGVTVIGGGQSSDAGADGGRDASVPVADSSVPEADGGAESGVGEVPGSPGGGGCGCRVATSRGEKAPMLLALLAALGVGWHRSRRRSGG